ncbi:outer membrane beta-barrel protein [Pseudomonadota bacterium]
MNKLPLFLATVFFTLTTSIAEAREIESGSIMFLGDTSLNSSSIDTKLNGTTLSADTTVLNLTGGYFFADNTAIGLMIANEDTSYSDGTNDSINMIGPVIAYNISLNTDFNLVFIAGLFNISGDEDDGTGASVNFDGDGTLLMASLGYFINDNVAVNFSIRRTSSDVDFSVTGFPSVSADLDETSTNLGLSVFF